MVDVHFEINRVIRYNVTEISEDRLESYLREHPEFVAELCTKGDLYGAIVVDGHQLADELAPLVHNLCFDAVVGALTGTKEYQWLGFAEPMQYRLSTDDADAVRLEASIATTLGDDEPWAATVPAREMLPALYLCGLRYVEFLEQLGTDGGKRAAQQAAYLRSFAERARDALGGAGLA